ncbi:MAG: alpha/beta hydrolase, partial [Gemmatimonadetes bacterium]|nr:alpha/beta hydrolase [Gemmatimonadota bacterium]NIT89960.1 alpha/beta hydrolase [Gemmatimonadota bacterium]NIU30736.1 alpha/beta hydrolase [Gemmatimonadota bacterium]NIV64093.1 alpha/beta fold hydrolase [Gemmatimonadota bacterium]NIW66851.1 alpha/beta fold hydrolase [Gemmatimonadota bacterium]
EWTMDAFGEDVVAVVDALKLDEVVLVGFSMGAVAALEAAERMPERTLGVVFVDMFNDEDRAMTEASARQIEGAFRANWGDTAFIRAFALSPDAPNELVYGITASLPEEPEEHFFAMLPYMTGWVDTEFGPTLRGLDVPVAAINSTRVPTDVE